MNRLEIFQKVYGTDYGFTVQELERLRQVTELIIAECIDQVKVFNARMDAGPRHIVEAIKQHFGVKE